MELNKAGYGTPISEGRSVAGPPPPAASPKEEISSFGADRTAIHSIQSRGTAEKKEPASPSLIEQGEKLARKVIRKNTHPVHLDGHKRKLSVLTAGSDHFEALWTRDACFGSLGILESGMPAKAVRDSLHAMLDRMRPDGEMPRRQGDWDNKWMVAASALHLKLPDPKDLDEIDFRNERGAYQFDANALPIIVAERYADRSGDVSFIKQHYEQLSKAADWLEKMDKNREEEDPNRLIDQPPSGDWKDVVGRHGVIAYTNAVAYQAQRSMARLDRLMGNDEKAAHREAFADKLKEDFNQRLWDEKLGYYKDSETTDLFSPDGNILAVVFGLADEKKAEAIFKKFEEVNKSQPLPYQATEKEYPDSYIPLWLKMAGMGHYHDRMVWTWQGSALAVAAAKSGRPDLARKVLSKVAEQAVKDGTFYEIYTPGGDPKPVHTWAYHSEPDFLWGAGTYLWAAGTLRRAGETGA